MWKHVEQLRRLGYLIDAQPARGYRLRAIPNRLSELELGPLLATRDLGRALHHFETIGSTNSRAWELGQGGASTARSWWPNTRPRAEAGAGERGRLPKVPTCTSQWSCGLTCRPRASSGGDAAGRGRVVRDATRGGTEATIKWPNDIQIGDKKVAGVLTELCAEADRIDFIVLGVGVNLNACLPRGLSRRGGAGGDLFDAGARSARAPRALHGRVVDPPRAVD